MGFVAKGLRIGQSMRDLHYLEDSVVIDMLAEHTLKLTHLFRTKAAHSDKEYQDCKKEIDKIIAELQERGLVPIRLPSKSRDEELLSE